MNQLELILNKLFSAYAHASISEATVLVYVELLSDIPLEELKIVVNQCIAESKFLPTIAELRERWRTLTRPIEDTSAIEAWASVTKAIREVGSWGTPRFRDPITQSIVNSIGWLTLCQSEDHMADRAHFLRQYEAIKRRVADSERLLPQARALVASRSQLPAPANGPQPIAVLLPQSQPARDPA